jgi:hypothetical protein
MDFPRINKIDLDRRCSGGISIESSLALGLELTVASDRFVYCLMGYVPCFLRVKSLRQTGEFNRIESSYGQTDRMKNVELRWDDRTSNSFKFPDFQFFPL